MCVFTHAFAHLSLYNIIHFSKLIHPPSVSPKMVKESQKIVAVDQDIPVIDMSLERSRVSMQIVKACETIGFFKVVNHGVDPDVISRLEQESINFFAKPVLEKKSVGSVVNRPFGYGLKNIGLKGDIGEVEYLLLHTNPLFLSQLSFGNDSTKFGYVT
ncbi:putative gibberellin 2-beta-dioxygenase [Arabidopsis thaliana]